VSPQRICTKKTLLRLFCLPITVDSRVKMIEHVYGEIEAQLSYFMSKANKTANRGTNCVRVKYPVN